MKSNCSERKEEDGVEECVTSTTSTTSTSSTTSSTNNSTTTSTTATVSASATEAKSARVHALKETAYVDMLLSKNSYATDKLTPAVEEETNSDRGRAPAAHYLKVAFACLYKSQKALAKVVWMEGEGSCDAQGRESANALLLKHLYLKGDIQQRLEGLEPITATNTTTTFLAATATAAVKFEAESSDDEWFDTNQQGNGLKCPTLVLYSL
jgi:hypothetical protein